MAVTDRDGRVGVNRRNAVFMIPWTRIVHLGDVAVMVPAAAAIAALLVTRSTWRVAVWWCLLIALGISLVAFSKIAFLAWGTGIRSLDFKALSGHATLTTAIMPVIFFLGLRHADPHVRAAGIWAGLGCGMLMALLLVMLDEHSASEVIAGCVLGAIVSLAALYKLRVHRSPKLNWWAIPLGILFLLHPLCRATIARILANTHCTRSVRPPPALQLDHMGVGQACGHVFRQSLLVNCQALDASCKKTGTSAIVDFPAIMHHRII
ncbi:hypothetical protein ACFQAT_01730 [Undibacterium arcticum]|uniref:hypothetical protein n=1 Tax=Undibacterium arcticum TaxID=1762892 RepID=UPI00360DB0CB